MGGGLDSRCVDHVYGADCAMHSTSKASDDVRMYPKHVELRIHQ